MVKIQVNQKDLINILEALEKVKKVAMYDALAVAEESAREYSAQVKKNITSQKYGDFGVPHKDWKKKAGQTASLFWYWLGTTFKAIAPKRIRRTHNESVWRVGMYGTFGGGVSGSSASKAASAAKRISTPEELKEALNKAIEKRKAAAKESMGKRVAEKGVIIHGPNSELVKRLNRERGYSK